MTFQTGPKQTPTRHDKNSILIRHKEKKEKLFEKWKNIESVGYSFLMDVLVVDDADDDFREMNLLMDYEHSLVMDLCQCGTDVKENMAKVLLDILLK